MIITQAIYEVKFSHDEKEEFSVIVKDEEGMNEDEIVTEAMINMQNKGVKLINCTLISCVNDFGLESKI